MSKKVIDAEKVENFLQTLEGHIAEVRGYFEVQENKDEEPITDEKPTNDNEPETPVEDEEPETPEPDEEIEEPVKEGNPKDPLSNFRAIIINPTTVECRWDAHVEGEIDIEYYRLNKEPVWKHSVNKYLKILIPISLQAYNIGNIQEGIEDAYFRAKKAKWTVFGIDFFTWYSDPVKAKYAKPEPVVVPVSTPIPDPIEEPTPQPEQPTEPVEPIPKPETDTVDVLVMFINKNFKPANYIDVNINGVWYNLSELPHTSPKWTVKLWDARGLILKIPSPVKSVEFRKSQVQFDGFDNGGTGRFTWKVGARYPDYDLSHPTQNGTEDPQGWATWKRIYKIVDNVKVLVTEWAWMISSTGIVGGNETTTIFGSQVPTQWSSTGKMSIIIGAAGKN